MTETILEFEKLLAPLGDNRVGQDLRVDAVDSYYQIKDTRSNLRNAERKSIELGESLESGNASWKPLLELCNQALCTKTKDIEITAWLIESLVRVHGFSGLRDGFKLLRELITTYWPDIYPTEDEEGPASKLVSIVGLSGLSGPGTLITPIHSVPIIVANNGQSYAAWQYQQAVELATVTDAGARNKRIEKGAAVLEDIQDAAKAAGQECFVKITQELQECQEEFAALTTVLEEKCGETAPELGNIRRALVDCETAIASLVKVFPQESTEAEATDASLNSSDVGVQDLQGSAADKQQIFARLQEFADFFRRTEPHSPLSYLIEQVIRWGNLELPELMQELMRDPNALSDYNRLVGIVPKPQNQQFGQNPDMGGMPAPDMGGGMGMGMGMDNNFGQPGGGFGAPGGQPPSF